MTEFQVRVVMVALFGGTCFCSGGIVFGGPQWLSHVSLGLLFLMLAVNTVWPPRRGR